VECYCGNAFGSYGISNNCNAFCPYNPSEICGGSNANSIYETTNSSTCLNTTTTTLITNEVSTTGTE